MQVVIIVVKAPSHVPIEAVDASTVTATTTITTTTIMSQVYASEPPTSGRVIFDTTHGPLEIQLWCRECPQTTRFFIQLCLDGFYDDVLFHRILPNTLLQCGALRQSSSAEKQTAAVDLDQSRAEWDTYRQTTLASAALERRQYELHSRLRFSHRGLVAMALPSTEEASNELSDDDLVQQQPQFIVTLEEAGYLDGKHVIFGTVSGPTVFNAIRMGRIEVDESTGQPIDMQDAPRIKSVKIAENPVHTSLVPQPKLPWRAAAPEKTAKKKKKRKGKLDTNVLSFGDEIEEEILIRPVKKSKPSDTNKDDDDDENDDDSVQREKAEKSKKVKASLSLGASPPPDGKDDLGERASTSDEPEKQKNATRPSSTVPDPINGDTNGGRDDEPAKEDPRRRKVSAVEARRAKYAAMKKSSKKARQEATLEKLMEFQGRVKETVVASKTEPAQSASHAKDNSLAARMARKAEQEHKPANDEEEHYHGQVLEGKDEDKLDYQKSSNWMATTFKCRRHIDHTAGSDGRKADDYEVVDDSVEVEQQQHKNDNKQHHKHSKKSHRRRE